MTGPQTDLLDEKLALGLRIAGVGLGEVDYVADTIRLDASAARHFDLPSDQPIPRDDLHARIYPDDWPAVSQELDGLLSKTEEDVVDVEHRVLTGSGEVRWIKARKQVRFDADRKAPVTGLVAIRDVTARREAEAKITFLMGEVNHRSKNLMTVVSRIAGLTATTPEERAFASRFEKRLAGLGATQDLLIRGQQDQVEVGDLVIRHLAPFGGPESGRLTVSGPPVALERGAAEGLGLALHELGTNAAKYGALSQSDGTISVDWTLDEDGTFRIHWQEAGGPTVSKPSRRGFGRMVIEEMAAIQLGGEVDLDYAPQGLRWSLTTRAGHVLA